MEFEVVDSPFVDRMSPLIYMWEIVDTEGVPIYRYVGKSQKGARRPLTHYSRNVRRLLAGKAYRRSKPDGFRYVHRALAYAVTHSFAIRLSFLCNATDIERIYQIEGQLRNVYCPPDLQRIDDLGS